MKILNIKNIMACTFACVILNGCSLEYEPYGVQGSVNFWKTEADVNKALDAFHAFTYEEGITGRGFMWFENCSDNLVTGRPQAEAAQIKNFQMSASNGRDAKDNWPAMYQLIAKANDVLRNVPSMDISAEVKNVALGQAHFYRAFAYLWLAPYYGDNGPNGGIPIVTENTPTDELDQPRPASVLANYDMIIEDMDKAAASLPLFSQLSEDDYGRPHRAAAWAFAARAALYAAQWDATYYQKVIAYCDKVINLTGADKRDLYPDYTKLSVQKTTSVKNIFSLFWAMQPKVQSFMVCLSRMADGVISTHGGYFQPTLELYKAFEAGDTRRDATILYPGQHITYIGHDIHFGVSPAAISSTSGMTFRKFMAPFEDADCIGKTLNPSGNNASNTLGTCLIRFADVLLMKAEALIWTQGEGNGEAKALLNKIRHRAGLPQNSSATKAELKNQRRCELAFEFQPSRHLDLVRWGDAQTVYAKPLHGIVTTTDGTTITSVT